MVMAKVWRKAKVLMMVLMGMVSAFVLFPAKAQAATCTPKLKDNCIYVLKEGDQMAKPQEDVYGIREYLGLDAYNMLGIREVDGKAQVLILDLTNSRADIVLKNEQQMEDYGIKILEENGEYTITTLEEGLDA